MHRHVPVPIPPPHPPTSFHHPPVHPPHNHTIAPTQRVLEEMPAPIEHDDGETHFDDEYHVAPYTQNGGSNRAGRHAAATHHIDPAYSSEAGLDEGTIDNASNPSCFYGPASEPPAVFNG